MTGEGGRDQAREAGEVKGARLMGIAGLGGLRTQLTPLSPTCFISIGKESSHVERSGLKKRVLDISFLKDFTENVAVRM